MCISICLMAQAEQHYKQQFQPRSGKQKMVKQPTCYGLHESEEHYRIDHNYKKNFSKPDQHRNAERDSVVRKGECGVLEGGYVQQHYKQEFSGRKKEDS
jgi:hypothetical protein